MSSNIIRISASIAAPIEKVWTYWTAPEHITQWNFADPSWHCPWAENDLRLGGVYKARMEARDGSFGFEFGAVYDEVVFPNRIAYTIGDGRKVVSTLTEAGTSTELVTEFEAESQNPPELQQQGWQAILNNFKQYTETH